MKLRDVGRDIAMNILLRACSMKMGMTSAGNFFHGANKVVEGEDGSGDRGTHWARPHVGSGRSSYFHDSGLHASCS